MTFSPSRYNRWLLLAQNWHEISRLLLAADVDSSGRVRLADVAAALQRLPELSALTPASASTTAALLDVEGTGSIHPDSVSWTFALPVVKRWLTPRCSEALNVFKRTEADRGARSVLIGNPENRIVHNAGIFLFVTLVPQWRFADSSRGYGRPVSARIV